MPHQLDYGRQEQKPTQARPIFRIVAGLFGLVSLVAILTWAYDFVEQLDTHEPAMLFVCVFVGFFYSGCIAVRGRMPFSKSY